MAGVRNVRLLVSSSGDADTDRQRVKRVAERINDAFPEIVRFEVLDADDGAIASDASLQPQISQSDTNDIVIAMIAGQHESLDEQDARIEKLLRDWLATHGLAAPSSPSGDEATPGSRDRFRSAALRSRRPVRLAAISTLAAVIFALVAIVALYSWRQSQNALDDATSMISALTEATSETVQTQAQLGAVEELLELSRKAINNFAAWPRDRRIVLQRARTYLILAEIDSDRGRVDRIREDTQAAVAMLDPLAKAGDLEARHLRARADRLIGTVHAQRNETDAAMLRYDRGIVELTELLKPDVDPKTAWPWMRSLAELYQSKGEFLLHRFDRRDAALAAFEQSRDLRLRLIELGQHNEQSTARGMLAGLQHDLAWLANKRADIAERQGNTDTALQLFTEARDIMLGLEDHIWDDLRWATNFGVVHANVGRLKRKKLRYVDAAESFDRAEEILSSVHRRDPKNVDRTTRLNWVRLLRAENIFRWGLQHNDRIRLLSAREQMQLVVATSTEITREPPPRAHAQLSKVREEAFLSAIDATLRQLNGNFESAAAGFLAASDIVDKGYLPDARNNPWADLLRESIEYLEWAGMAYVKAQKPTEAHELFKRALDRLIEYRAVFDEKAFEEMQQRIGARL
jgi:tetratricopeptide (TPR) repeat protein